MQGSESFTEPKATLDAAIAGNDEAQRKFFKIVRDLVGEHLTEIRKL
jgi:hypothetical protein